jgi:hypothetical protein
MTRKHALVSTVVAAICTAVLVIFTDIEISVVRWVNCGPLAGEGEREARRCR